MNLPEKKWFSLVDYIIHIIMFLILALLLVTSHQVDWDYFYTNLEVDLQSWFLDHDLPLWSYSFCGGSPRISDPQAFGLSPVFIPVLIFGSVIGAKIIYFGLTIIGYFSLRFIICSITDTDKRIASYLSLYYVLGYFFIWHARVGHITFATIHIWVLVYAISIYLIQQSKFCTGYFFALIIAIISGLTAGPYHALIFFALPVSIFLLPALMYCKKIHLHKTGIYQIVIAIIISFIITAPKLYAIIQHQVEFPRTLFEIVQDNSSLFESFLYLFTPTYEDKFLGLIKHTKHYKVWEYAGFSWNHITFFVCLIFAIKTKIIENRAIIIASLLIVLFGLLLMLGDFSPDAPFNLLNKYLFHDSMRMSGRFVIVVCFGLTLLQAAILYNPNSQQLNLLLNIQRIGILSSIVIPMSFALSQNINWTKLYKSKPGFPDKFQGVIWLREDYPYYPDEFGMYITTIRGLSILNCYNPFNFERRIQYGNNKIFKQIPYSQPFNFVKVPEAIDEKIKQRCLSNSYYDSQKIHLDSSCPENTCLFMNGISNNDPIKRSLTLQNGLYCLTQTPINERPNE